MTSGQRQGQELGKEDRMNIDLGDEVEDEDPLVAAARQAYSDSDESNESADDEDIEEEGSGVDESNEGNESHDDGIGLEELFGKTLLCSLLVHPPLSFPQLRGGC